MTLEELLTWPLPRRIEWLRRREGSHDKLAAKLGTSRQTVIDWEKGAQPSAKFRGRLARVSGLPEEAWSRAASVPWSPPESRLQALGETVDDLSDNQTQILLDVADLRERLVRAEAALAELRAGARRPRRRS